jgi:hypothetical protein
MQIIMATHSTPQIINDRWDLTQEQFAISR